MHALEGVRLIDFGQYLAGPFGPMVVGDLGADVIKVEPVTGDGMRMAGQPFFGCRPRQAEPRARPQTNADEEIALQLVEHADIVHHNMTAGVAVRLGIGYEDCKRVKPDIVYCNTWAYGLEGPLAAVRRARPAVPGLGRARIRTRPGPRRQRPQLPPLRHDGHGQRDAVGGRMPHRPVPPTA